MGNKKFVEKLSVTLVPKEAIEAKIFLLRGCRVMIDRDLARLYNVETKYLNRQVRRNIERFPAEFMFQLNEKEKHELVTNWHRFGSLKHSLVLPYAFTEHGVAMLASVLNSAAAVNISIDIIKTFINLRKMLFSHKELAYKLDKLEKRIDQKDEEVQAIFEAIRELMEPPPAKRKPKIGFFNAG
jgi:phage regulator Rha-like protein